jgi:hypothetical protein
MFKKFFYLYLVGGAIALGLFVYDVISTYPNLSSAVIAQAVIPGVILFYLAYKTYHEKKDQELM